MDVFTKIKKRLEFRYKQDISCDPDTIILVKIGMKDKPGILQDAMNQIIWIKRAARIIDKQIKENRRQKRINKERLAQLLKHTGAKNVADFTQEQYDYYLNVVEIIDTLDAQAKNQNTIVMMLNERLELCCKIFDENNLNFNDFCSLVGINVRNAQINKEIYEENAYWELLFHGIEDTREEEGWKSNRHGMPFFDLLLCWWKVILDSNKEVKEKVNNYIMHDMGFAKHALTVNTNECGEVVEIKKYYPELKAIK